MRRWIVAIVVVCALVLWSVTMYLKDGHDFDALAADGKIQDDAPVKASVEVVIQAPVEKVYGLLTDVNHWPKWQSAIKAAHIDGPVASGTTFEWSTDSMRIHSKIARVVPNAQIAWTGKASIATAIHVWNLEPLPGGRTRVSTDESMSGFVLTSFYSSRDLDASDKEWLDRLKQEAERSR